jgi:hypothetical protein
LKKARKRGADKMPYQVTANVRGEPARIQQRGGIDTFQNRSEAESFQRELRQAGFDRVDIIESEGKPPETITAPASSPDRYSKPASSSQIVTDVETGKNVPLQESSQARIEENIQRARQEKPNWSLQEGNIADIREQSYDQAAGFYGVRKQNLTPSERLQQQDRQKEADIYAQQAAAEDKAAGIITGFMKMPSEYQTAENLGMIAGESARRQRTTPTLKEEFAMDIFRRQGNEVSYSDGLMEIKGKGRKTIIDYDAGMFSIGPKGQTYKDTFIMSGPDSFEYSKGFSGQIGTGKFPWYSQGAFGAAWAFGRGVKAKSLNKIEGFGEGYGTNSRSMGRADVLDTNVSSSLVANQTAGEVQEKNTTKGFFFGDKGGIGVFGLPISVAKGYGKLISEGFENIKTGRIIKDPFRSLTTSKYGSDVNVKTAVSTTAFISALSFTPALIQKLAYGGILASSTFKTAKTPSAGSFGELAFLASPLAFSKLPRFSYNILEGKSPQTKGLLGLKPPQTTGRLTEPLPKTSLSKLPEPSFRDFGIDEANIMKPVKAQRRITGINFIPEIKGELPTYQSLKTIAEQEAVKITSKYGTIQDLDFTKPIRISTTKGRVTPEVYGYYLENIGELNSFEYVGSIRGGKVWGVQYPDTLSIQVALAYTLLQVFGYPYHLRLSRSQSIFCTTCNNHHTRLG